LITLKLSAYKKLFSSHKYISPDDEVFAERLLKEEKVAVVPGRSFGDSGKDFVRCSYATAYEKIEQALERMQRFLKRI